MAKKKALILAALCVVVSLPMQAAGKIQTKKVQYVSPAFYYNGVQKSLSMQPVMIDGTTYLPIRALCDATGLAVQYNGTTLSVSGGASSTYSMQAELQAKDYEIASLKKELQDLKNKMGVVSTTTSSSSGGTYDQTSGSDILGTELSATRKDLENLYADYFKGIDFDFSVTVSSGKVKVNITYDNSDENKTFNKLSSREVKDFVREVCETVRAHHDNVVITGTIKYSGSTKYSFTYSKRDDLSCSTGSSSYSSSSYDDITSSQVERIVRDEGTVDIDGYGSRINIEKVSASVSDSREKVTYRIYLKISDDTDRLEAWNKYVGNDNKNEDLLSDMRSIARDIEDETDYDIFGEVYDYTTSKLIADYDFYEDRLRTYDLKK